MKNQCTATSSRTGERCKRAALRGSNICTSHGVNSRTRIAAKRRVALAEATALVEAQGVEPMTDVATQILVLASEARSLLDILAARVAELESFSSTDKLGSESISAILGAYQSQQEKTGRLLIAIAKLGLEDRRTRVAEADHRRLVQAVQEGVYSDQTLTHEQKQEILRSIFAALESVYE